MAEERILPISVVDDRPVLTVEQMHEIGNVFAKRVFTDSRVAPKLQASKLRICFEYYDERWGGEETSITIDFSRNPVEFHLGVCDIKPEVTMRMHAYTAHRFFMQKLNMMIAVAKGEIKVKGPLNRAMRMLPSIKPGFDIYRDVLKELGYHELLKYPKDKREKTQEEERETFILPHQAKEEGNA